MDNAGRTWELPPDADGPRRGRAAGGHGAPLGVVSRRGCREHRGRRDALFQLAQADEDAGAFAQALVPRSGCQDRRGPVGACGPSERPTWIAWLDGRSEGNLRLPLATLEHVRRHPELASDPAAVEALAHEAERAPQPGLVRVEARMFVAEAWLGRMHRPADALAQLHAVSDDPEADPLTSRLAEREIVDTLVGEGRALLGLLGGHRAREPPRPTLREADRQALVRRRKLRGEWPSPSSGRSLCSRASRCFARS